MPISAPGSNDSRRSRAGFTLVELMVVILVIALASAVAMMAMPDPRGRAFDEAARLAAKVRAARDIAILGGAPVSLWVASGGYGFDRRVDGAWLPMAEKPFRVERWREGTRVGIAGGARARIVFDGTGLADRPLDLSLTRDRATVTARIAADGSARVE